MAERKLINEEAINSKTVPPGIYDPRYNWVLKPTHNTIISKEIRRKPIIKVN